MSKETIYSNNRGLSLKVLAPEDKEAFNDLICQETEHIKNGGVQGNYYESFIKHMFFYVISARDRDGFIGYICVTPHDNGEYEIGIYLSPEYRGQGIAVEFLPKAMEHYSEIHDVPYFIYRTKAYNIASQKVAKALGAIKLEDEGDLFRDRLIVFSETLNEEIRDEFRKEFLKHYEEDYDPGKENVIKYRIDISPRKSL